MYYSKIESFSWKSNILFVRELRWKMFHLLLLHKSSGLEERIPRGDLNVHFPPPPEVTWCTWSQVFRLFEPHDADSSSWNIGQGRHS